ncbi:MAG TPA: hypothetical protein VJQ43_05085 [Thermoplasmata archaeon]|nr:hypothetical protein [Thermoplasmata archaeon]
MSAAPKNDPVRATLLAILKQLNQAETVHEGALSDQALELPEIERRLSEFWAIDNGSVKVGLALGLLLRNGLVSAAGGPDYSWQRQRAVAQRYQITPEGKKFLVDSIQTSDRIG